MLYLRQYLELYVMFEAIDVSGDARIELSEFGAAVGLLKRWGIEVARSVFLSWRLVSAFGGVSFLCSHLLCCLVCCGV